MSATDTTTTTAPPKSSSAAAKESLTGRFSSVVAIIIAALWTLPTFGLFVSSLRPENEIKTNGWWNAFTNPQFTLDNYSKVLNDSDVSMVTYFVNSFVISIPSVLIPISLATLAAYAFAWMKFPGRDTLFVGVFALQIVPIQVTMIPLLTLYVNPPIGPQLAGSNAFGGGFYTIWLSHSIFALPLAIYLLHNFMREIPGDLIESARVDGAGHRRLRHLPVPLGVERPVGRAGVRRRQSGCLTTHGATRRARWPARRGLAPAVRRRVHQPDRAPDRVPVPSALLRPRPARGRRQGLTVMTGAARRRDFGS